MIDVPRRYELKRRAARQAETRRRIVEAAIELHGSVGITRTTVTQIAKLAGVGRPTVYRHFADELALVGACSGLYWERNPFPDMEPWRAVGDPEKRTRIALLESYAYHRRTEPMMSRVFAEAADSPVMADYHAYWQCAAEVVASPWPESGEALLRAAIGHALVFPTWQSLVRDQGLEEVQAAELMQRFIRAAAKTRQA
jgi:AcrR family transcriptional regulator